MRRMEVEGGKKKVSSETHRLIESFTHRLMRGKEILKVSIEKRDLKKAQR